MDRHPGINGGETLSSPCIAKAQVKEGLILGRRWLTSKRGGGMGDGTLTACCLFGFGSHGVCEDFWQIDGEGIG